MSYILTGRISTPEGSRIADKQWVVGYSDDFGSAVTAMTRLNAPFEQHADTYEFLPFEAAVWCTVDPTMPELDPALKWGRPFYNYQRVGSDDDLAP